MKLAIAGFETGSDAVRDAVREKERFERELLRLGGAGDDSTVFDLDVLRRHLDGNTVALSVSIHRRSEADDPARPWIEFSRTRCLACLVGAEELSERDRRYLRFADAFEKRFR